VERKTSKNAHPQPFTDDRFNSKMLLAISAFRSRETTCILQYPTCCKLCRGKGRLCRLIRRTCHLSVSFRNLSLSTSSSAVWLVTISIYSESFNAVLSTNVRLTPECCGQAPRGAPTCCGALVEFHTVEAECPEGLGRLPPEEVSCTRVVSKMLTFSCNTPPTAESASQNGTS